ncbi:hypothetical protein CPB84DRAFT_1786894 [Gymnopilus junonius]|uniref:Uncharacterized protein n=1 Tax=Gymnopilus junonius TaxID=109634 RepID=A0A9P5TKI9_GYMJU|nr:hypothetical protein CPB84DRAFT_1786894 [Gymnopilus junonius]
MYVDLEEHTKLSKEREKERVFNVELVRQLEIITVRDPYLADYVKEINIEVVEFSIKPVLVELARCLSLFPNLRHVKIQVLRTNKAESSLANIVRSVFSKRKYPQIRSVGICDVSYPFLSACPEAHSVSWRWSNFNQFRFKDNFSLQARLPVWPWVEKLQLTIPSAEYLEGNVLYS